MRKKNVTKWIWKKVRAKEEGKLEEGKRGKITQPWWGPSLPSEPPSFSAASWASRGPDPRLRKPRFPRLRRRRRACAVLGLPRRDWLNSMAVGKHKQRARLLWGRGCDNRRRHPRTNREWMMKLGRVAYPRPWFCRTVERPGSRRCHRRPGLLLPPPGQGGLHPSERMGPDHPLPLGVCVSARGIRQIISKMERRDDTSELKYLEPGGPGKNLRWGPGVRVRRARRPTPSHQPCWSAQWPAPAAQLVLYSAVSC